MRLKTALRLKFVWSATLVLSALPSAARADIVYAMDDAGDVIEYNGAGGVVATFNRNASDGGLIGVNGLVVSGRNVFVTQDFGTYTGVGEYQLNPGANPTIAAVNTNLIPSSNGFGQFPYIGIAPLGSNLLVVDNLSGTVGEYTQSGTAVNSSFISGLSFPATLAVTSSDIFIWSGGPETTPISEYDTSGNLVNAALITGLAGRGGLAVYGNDLFILNPSGSVAEYDTSGNLVNAALISGLPNEAGSIVVDDGNLLISDGKSIYEYDTSGNLITASFATVPTFAYDQLFVVATPEPATWVLFASGTIGLLAVVRRRLCR